MRFSIHNLVSRILLGNVAGSLPFNLVTSFRESRIDQTVLNDLTNYELVHKAEVFECNNPSFRKADWMVTRYPLNEKRIIGLRHATVYPRSGGVVTRSGKVIAESIGSLFKILTYSGFVSEASRNRFHVGKSTSKVIATGIGGFYHWMFECLPALIRCFQLYPGYKILLPNKRPRFVDESLELILGQNWKDQVLLMNRPCVVDEVVFYSKSNGGQYVHPNDISLLRDKLLTQAQFVPSTGKIFVSRKNAKSRSCDEKPVVNLLSQKGYEIVELERIPFAKQIGLFAKAHKICGYHGAGLSHGIFTPKDCCVLELFRADGLNDCYARLFLTINRRYDFAVSSPNKPNEFRELNI